MAINSQNLLEQHRSERIGWLRASVLGANDGIVSTASLIVEKGLNHTLARKVAEQLMAHDALGSHARDELGITEGLRARPIQAALASAGTFSIGACLPLLMVFVSPRHNLIVVVSASSLLFLILLGILAGLAGGATIWKGALRVGFWGALAMAATALIGKIFGTIV